MAVLAAKANDRFLAVSECAKVFLHIQYEDVYLCMRYLCGYKYLLRSEHRTYVTHYDDVCKND